MKESTFVKVALILLVLYLLVTPNPACANDTHADPDDIYTQYDDDLVVRIDKDTGHLYIYTTDDDPDILMPTDGGDFLIIPGDVDIYD